EEAVEQVDPSAQIEGNLAVIPEHLPEHELCEDAAHVLIGSAQDCTDHEDVPVRLVPVLVQKSSGDGDSQSPDNAERSPYKAAPAHPYAGGETAEERFGDVAKESAGKKEPEQLVETAAFGEPAFLQDLFRPLFKGWVCLRRAGGRDLEGRPVRRRLRFLQAVLAL